MAVTPWSSPLTERLSDRFTYVAGEFSTYAGQRFFTATSAILPALLEYLKTDESFDFLVDLTAVDYPQRAQRFELVYILYSYRLNERLRIKSNVAETEKPPTVTGVFAGANWLEREAFDMFGIEFAGHPDMRRILLPDEWQGHPLRKDYGITQMDNDWVRENLGIDSGQ